MELVPQPQTSIYEKTIDNPELEAALEARETARERASKTRKTLEGATEHVKTLAEGLDLGLDAPIRVGRFVLTRRRIDGTEVAFERAPSERLSIRKVRQ
jgi:hypothetical protein